MAVATRLAVAARDRTHLTAWVRAATTRRSLAERARIILLSAEGLSAAAIAERLGVVRLTVYKWRQRYGRHGLGGLHDRPRPGQPARAAPRARQQQHAQDARGDRLVGGHPRVMLHFTPTSASWLNAVEGWFAQLERRAVRRGSFTSVSDLRSELRRFIAAHNKYAAKPFVWTKPADVILDSVARASRAMRINSAGH